MNVWDFLDQHWGSLAFLIFVALLVIGNIFSR